MVGRARQAPARMVRLHVDCYKIVEEALVGGQGTVVGADPVTVEDVAEGIDYCSCRSDIAAWSLAASAAEGKVADIGCCCIPEVGTAVSLEVAADPRMVADEALEVVADIAEGPAGIVEEADRDADWDCC